MRGVGQRHGKVERFDEGTGLGEVKADDGKVYIFHCTELSDGSRSAEAGTDVDFVLWPGHRGNWEARGLVKVRATREGA